MNRSGQQRWGAAGLVLLAGLLLTTVSAAQSPGESHSVTANPAEPITVGPREAVGKESFSDKAVKNVIGGMFGRKGKSSGRSGPRTKKDPTRKSDYTMVEAKALDLEVGARAAWKDNSLMVSTRIEESDDKGTFQTVFLQDCEGRLLYPARIEIYKIWSEHSVSVSWSKTTSVDGRVTGAESGAWNDSWSDSWSSPAGEFEVAGPPGVWQQSGYSRAHLGVRQLGAYFNVDPGEFDDCDLAFVAHVTRPEQDPVVTEPMPFLLSSSTGDKPRVKAGDRETIAARSLSATVPPCIEALLNIEEKKSALLAQLDDPARYLQAALAAAHDLGNATRAAGIANANLAAEQALLDNGKSKLEAWDQWFEQRIAQRQQRRYEKYGASEPSWAKGSRKRAEKRHQERTAELRQQVAEQEQKVAQAQQAANAAAQARQSAQDRFDRALEDFRRALAALRNAKDQFAELVVRHYRCSPCEVIAGHWTSAARLKDLLDRLASMLAQAQARVAAQLSQARQAATEAAQAASDAEGQLASLENRRSEIEQDLRDAVDTSSDCLSLEPQEGWGWMNIASMDGTRGNIFAEGSGLSWSSRFKGLDIRVWSKPGCLRETIEGIKWGRVNELNEELHDLQSKLAEAEQAAAEARRAASVAQAAVAGLEAEQDALNELERALHNSGIEKNTDNVLKRLDKLSEDCAAELKETIRGASDARRRKGDADRRTAAGTGRKDSARRRAGRAADDLDDMDPSVGSPDDKDRHDKLGGKADGLAEKGDPAAPAPGEPPDPPETLEEAEEQRKKAEKDADEAEERANRVENEADELEDAVDELEDEVERLEKRLADWRRYHAAMAAYKDCLRKKQAAIEELAELNEENASALQELADLVGEAADGLSEAADQLGDAGQVSDKARKASDKAGDLAKKLERIGNAMEVLDAVMRADDLSPSEKLEAMSKAFEELREWLPELPGVTQMLEFYNEAMKAIAGKIKDIEDAQIKAWSELVEAGIADAEDAPVGIRKQVKKAARIRELMKIIARNCGKLPVPPTSTAN